MLPLILMTIEKEEDEEKFKLIYKEYYDLVFMISKSFFKNEQDVEDAAYESFFKISTNISKIEDIKSNRTKAFIAIITKNVCINIYNKMKKIRDFENSQLGDLKNYKAEYYHKEPEQQGFLENYKSCLKKLTEKEYEILVLRYVNKLKTKEIAELLNISDNTARQRLYYVKQKLKSLLEEEFDDG